MEQGTAPGGRFHEAYAPEVVCVANDAICVIQTALGPAYNKTGGGDCFQHCMRAVSTWTPSIFAAEADVIFVLVPFIQATMIGAIIRTATNDGREYSFATGYTAEQIVRDIIEALLLHAVDEPVILSGQFFTDSAAALAVAVRLISHIIDRMVEKWIIFATKPQYELTTQNIASLNTELHSKSTKTSPVIQLKRTAEYNEGSTITPDDSVSVAYRRHAHAPTTAARTKPITKAEAVQQNQTPAPSTVSPLPVLQRRGNEDNSRLYEELKRVHCKAHQDAGTFSSTHEPTNKPLLQRCVSAVDTRSSTATKSTKSHKSGSIHLQQKTSGTQPNS